MSTKDVMNEMEEVMRREKLLVRSEIEGLSDMLWSLGARTIGYNNNERLIKWFNTPIPAFDNRKPMDILLEDGEEELYRHMCTMP